MARLIMTSRQLARELGLTTRGINKLIARGDLPPPCQIGRRRFWLRSTLKRFFESHQRPKRKDGSSAPDGSEASRP